MVSWSAVLRTASAWLSWEEQRRAMLCGVASARRQGDDVGRVDSASFCCGALAATLLPWDREALQRWHSRARFKDHRCDLLFFIDRRAALGCASAEFRSARFRWRPRRTSDPFVVVAVSSQTCALKDLNLTKNCYRQNGAKRITLCAAIGTGKRESLHTSRPANVRRRVGEPEHNLR